MTKSSNSNQPWKRLAKVALLAGAAAISLSACASVGSGGADGLYAKPIGNSPVTTNPTPYTNALVCLGARARASDIPAPRIAVGRIADYTGKVEQDGGGAKITQGASLMAMSAFAKAGARLVERYDTSVSEMELKYANNKLISDVGPGEFRQITAGQVPGSDYYLVGGVTELNYNIHSSGVDVLGGGTGATDGSGLFSRRVFVMNVGLDLRLVDTETLEVVDVISYQKQIVGREISAGLFSFFDGATATIDVGAGGKAMEPVQLAVRAVIERAVVEMSSNLYGMSPASCALDDPLFEDEAAQFNAYTVGLPAEELHHASDRPDVYRGYSDPYGRPALRGGYN